MHQQKKIKGGVPIAQVQVVPTFSGKIYYALNQRGSEILLDRDQVQEFQQIINQEKKANQFQQQKIPAFLFKKRPENITQMQRKIQQNIFQQGNQKQSQITSPGSSMFPSVIFQGALCVMCEQKQLTIEESEQAIQKLTRINDHLSQEVQHLNKKLSAYQNKIDILKIQYQQILSQNIKLNKSIQKPKSQIYLKSFSTQKQKLNLSRLNKQVIGLQKSRLENKTMIQKSKALQLNLIQNFKSLINSKNNPYFQAQKKAQINKNSSLVLLEIKTQKNQKARLSVQLTPQIIEQVKLQINQSPSKSQILIDTFQDVMNSVSQSQEMCCILGFQEYLDLIEQ